MKKSSRAIALLSVCIWFSNLGAQEVTTKWDVEIPVPITDSTPSAPAPKPEPLDLKVVRSRTTRLDVEEAPEIPEIPEMPDLADGGPSFVVVEGVKDSPAMDTLEQIHDLYRKEGARMEEAYHARVKAYEERKAYLIANPPKPKDVNIQFWRRNSPSPRGVQALEGEVQP